MFAVSPMLGFCTKPKTNFWFFSRNEGVFSVCGFAHSALQFFKINVCVERGHTCAYIKLTSVFTKLGTFYLYCTLVWFLKLNTLYLHPLSCLSLILTNSPVFTPPGYRDHGYNGTNNTWTPPLTINSASLLE